MYEGDVYVYVDVSLGLHLPAILQALRTANVSDFDSMEDFQARQDVWKETIEAAFKALERSEKVSMA